MKNTAKIKTKSVDALQDEVVEMCAQVYAKYSGTHITNPRKEIDREREFEDVEDVFALIGTGVRVAFANAQDKSALELSTDDLQADERKWRAFVELFHATMTALLADERLDLAGAHFELIARQANASVIN